MSGGIIAEIVGGAGGTAVKGCHSTKPFRPLRPRWEDVFNSYPQEDDVSFFRKYFTYSGPINNGQIEYNGKIIESGAARVSIALIKSRMTAVFNAAAKKN
jgi:protein gp37